MSLFIESTVDAQTVGAAMGTDPEFAAHVFDELVCQNPDPAKIFEALQMEDMPTALIAAMLQRWVTTFRAMEDVE